MNMDFKSAEELLNLCEENQLPISEVMRQRECLLGEVPRDSVNHRMGKAWEIMRSSATQPLKKPIKSMQKRRASAATCWKKPLPMPWQCWK